MTQQSCPSVQQSLPQHVAPFEHCPPVLAQGGASQVPPTHVDFLPSQCVPHPPQLCGSSYVSTHAPSQQVWPFTHATPQSPESSSPPLPDPLEPPELPPLLPPLVLPLEPPELPPEVLPELLPLLLPLELPDPLLVEPLLLPLPEVLLPPPLLEELPPSLAASTEASAVAFPSESVAPPHRAVSTSNPANPTVQTK
jgi:hypothetical protein